MTKREEMMGRLGKMGGRLFVSAAAMRQELEAMSAAKLNRLAGSLKLVRREEFEAVEAMLKEARRAQEELQRRVAALEAVAGVRPRASGKKLPGKSGAKSSRRKSRD